MTHLKKLLLMVLLCSSAAVSAASMEKFQSEEKAKQPNLHNSNVTNPVAPSGLGESAGGGSGAIKWITAFSGSTTNSFSVPSGDFYEINGKTGSSITVPTNTARFNVVTCRTRTHGSCGGNGQGSCYERCELDSTTKTVGSTCTVSIRGGRLNSCAKTVTTQTQYCVEGRNDYCASKTLSATVRGTVTKVRYLGL